MRFTLAAVGRALAYFVLLEAMLVAAILYWPDFQGNVDGLRAAAPLDWIKKTLDKIEQTGVSGYVMAQHYFKGCNTLGIAAAALFACGAVAGEAHRGSLEIWLSRPVPRWRLLAERWLAGALGVVVPVYATSATVPALLSTVDEHMDMHSLLLASTHQSVFLLAVFSVTFLLSAAGRNPTRIAFAVLVTCTFEFSLYMVKEVTHYSLFRLVDLEDFVRIHTSEELDWRVCLPLLAVAAAATAAAFWVFQRRRP